MGRHALQHIRGWLSALPDGVGDDAGPCDWTGMVPGSFAAQVARAERGQGRKDNEITEVHLYGKFLLSRLHGSVPLVSAHVD